MTWPTPLRIRGPRISRCCTWPTFLVRSKKRGFVTSNCTKCGNGVYVSNDEFFNAVRCDVDCPECGDRMYKDFVGDNYGFKCPTCHSSVIFADLLPWWHELLPANAVISLRST